MRSRYGTEHGDPFLGRTMGTQADYSHEVAQIIDDEVRKLIEAAHTEAWEILTEYRDVLDILAGELLEKETLHRAELEAIFGDVKKRPRLTDVRRLRWPHPVGQAADQDAGRAGHRARRAVAEAGARARVQDRDRAGQSKAAAEAARQERRQTAHGANGTAPDGPTQPDYGAPAGWHAPGWPPHAEPAAAATSSSRSHQQPLVSATAAAGLAGAAAGTIRAIRRISPTRSPAHPAPQGGPTDTRTDEIGPGERSARTRTATG